MGLFWSKKANCRFDIEDNIYINMNNEQIEQAINNYIINAYEHIPEKGTAVVTLKSVDDKAVISVFNNSNNIKEEELSKIWEGFYQTDERGERIKRWTWPLYCKKHCKEPQRSMLCQESSQRR